MMHRFVAFTLLAVGASAECLVCLNGGPPGNPNAVDSALGGYTCAYVYNNRGYVSEKQCAVIQLPENQVLCGCGSTLAPVAATSAPIASASVAPVTPEVPVLDTSAPVTAAPVSGITSAPTTTSPVASVSSTAPITAAPIAPAASSAPVTAAPVSSGGIFAPTEKSPPKCTGRGQDPYEFYANTTSIPCCDEATECLSNWDGDDRMYYRCVMGCTATSAPVTAAPISPVSSTAPVTAAPVAPVSSTAPVTIAPVSATDTASPAGSSAPVTSVPVSSAPVSFAPVSSAPVSSAPVSSAPVSSAPASSAPSVTLTPTSNDTSAPVTVAPISSFGTITIGNATPTDINTIVASANQEVTSGTPRTSIGVGLCASVVFAMMMMMM